MSPHHSPPTASPLFPEGVFFREWFSRVRATMAERNLSVTDLSRLLGQPSPSPLMRRFRGVTAFGVYEFLAISTLLDVPTSLTPPPPPTLELSLPGSSLDMDTPFEAEAYVQSVVRLARALQARRDRDLAATYYISTADIPFARLCAYPPLAALHLFLLEGAGAGADVTFDLARMRAERASLFEGFGYLADFHAREDNVEVWGPTPLATTLRDISHLCEWGAIDANGTATVLEELERLTADLREQARLGRKPGGGRFELYASPEPGGSTDVVVEGEGFHLTFHTLRRPHYTVSREAVTARIFRKLFEERRRVATPINGLPPYAYRRYTDEMSAAIAEARR